jgi:hypothetical protein
LKATALQRPDARAKRSYAASIMRGARRSFEFSIDRGARLYVIRRTTGAA